MRSTGPRCFRVQCILGQIYPAFVTSSARSLGFGRAGWENSATPPPPPGLVLRLPTPRAPAQPRVNALPKVRCSKIPSCGIPPPPVSPFFSRACKIVPFTNPATEPTKPSFKPKTGRARKTAAFPLHNPLHGARLDRKSARRLMGNQASESRECGG